MNADLERKAPGRKGWIAAATLGGFITSMAGMMMLIGLLPLGRLERTVIGALAFAPLWTGMMVLVSVASSAARAWRQQLGLTLLFAAIAAVGFGLRG